MTVEVGELKNYDLNVFSGNEYIYEDENVVLIYNVETDKTTTLLNRTIFVSTTFWMYSDYIVSIDFNRIRF